MRARGIGYEKKAQKELFRRYSEGYCESPWLRYFADGKWRFCQPDGLLIRPDCSVLIFEIKHSHTQRAWWQLRRLYQPVVQKLFPGWPIEVCEVVKWYEPDPFFPEFVRLMEDPLTPTSDFKVHIDGP